MYAAAGAGKRARSVSVTRSVERGVASAAVARCRYSARAPRGPWDAHPYTTAAANGRRVEHSGNEPHRTQPGADRSASCVTSARPSPFTVTLQWGAVTPSSRVTGLSGLLVGPGALLLAASVQGLVGSGGEGCGSVVRP